MLFLSTHATDVLLAMTGKSFCIDSLFYPLNQRSIGDFAQLNSIQALCLYWLTPALAHGMHPLTRARKQTPIAHIA